MFHHQVNNVLLQSSHSDKQDITPLKINISLGGKYVISMNLM